MNAPDVLSVLSLTHVHMQKYPIAQRMPVDIKRPLLDIFTQKGAKRFIPEVAEVLVYNHLKKVTPSPALPSETLRSLFCFPAGEAALCTQNAPDQVCTKHLKSRHGGDPPVQPALL